ncbi:MAG TPA: mannosyltransferase family protein [Chloroflexota bacterium]|nr:mannosyltransferase family protein [Chloroflexota bacterium]
MQDRLSIGNRLDFLGLREWRSREAARRLARRAALTAQRWLLSDILSIFLATRLIFLLITYFGRALMHDPALVGSGNVGLGTGYLLDSWFYRDSQWYLTIVQDGYHYFGAGHRSAVAFFPVYPMIVKALNSLLGIDSGICAMLVSNLSFLGAMVFLYKLCLREYGEGTARRAVFYMAIFPTAFFTFAPYSEPLFLLCSVASLYYMRGQRWWLAGIFGGLAAATRVPGVLLALAFAWEYLRTHRLPLPRIRLRILRRARSARVGQSAHRVRHGWSRHAASATAVAPVRAHPGGIRYPLAGVQSQVPDDNHSYLQHDPSASARSIGRDVLAGALIPGGLGAYMVYLYGLAGDPLAFIKSAAGWGRAASWPWQVLATSLADVPRSAQSGQYLQAHALIENGLVIACLLLLLIGIRRIPFSFVIYGLACLAVLLSAPVATSDIPVTSMSRYLLVIAPVYIVLAQLGRFAIFDRLYTLLSVGGLAIFTTLFLNHMWGA